MTSNHNRAIGASRRDFLKRAGAATATAGAASLAGCTDLIPGSGSSDTQTLRIGLPPVGSNNALIQHMQDSGTLDEYMNEAGYEYDLQLSWDGPTLFVSGQLDMMMGNPMELAQMGANQGLETACIGGITKLTSGIAVRPDSEYSVSETGSIEASLQQMAEDEIRYGFDGWSSGDMPFLTFLFDQYGLEFNPNQTPFEMVNTQTDAIGDMLASGELEAASLAPYHPGYIPNILPEVEINSLFNELSVMDELGYEEPLMLAGIGVKQEDLESHREGFVAFSQAFGESLAWYHSNVEELKQWDGLADMAGQQTQEQAEFFFDWNAGTDLSSIYGEEYEQWELPSAPLYDSTYLSDEIVASHEDFLDRGAESGFFPTEWRDYVTLEQIDELS